MTVPHRYHFFSLAVLLLFLDALPVFGQQPDIRLSTDVVLYEVPEDIRIQDAAQIGNVSLAVWGTVLRESDTSVIGGLVWQMRRDTTTVDIARIVHSDAARPFGVVSVVAMGDRFLVMWNDRRGGDTAIYTRAFDASGVWLGDDYLFSVGRLTKMDGAIGFSANGHYLILWNDSRPEARGLYKAHLDASLRLIGQESFIDSNFIKRSVRYSGLGDEVLIDRDSASALLLKEDSTFAMRLIPPDILNHPYYINNDGSVVVLRDTVLHFYRNLIDTTVVKRVSVPGVMNPFPMFQWRTDLYCLVKDSSGNYGLVYPFHGPGRILIRRTFMVGDTLPVVDSLKYLYVGSDIVQMHYQEDGTLFHECENSSVVLWEYRESSRGNPNSYKFGVAYHISSTGDFSNFNGQLDLCSTNQRLSVAWTGNLISKINVKGWGDLRGVMASRLLRTPQHVPVLMNSGASTLVTWRNNFRKYELYDWQDLQQTVQRNIGAFNIPGDKQSSDAKEGSKYYSRLYDVKDLALLLFGSASYNTEKTGSTSVKTTYYCTEKFFQPTDSGWHEEASVSASGMHANLGPTYFTGPLISVVGHIPEKKQVITYRGYRGYTYSHSESELVKSWSLDIEGYVSTLGFTNRTSYQVLPLDIHDAIVIVQDTFLVQITDRIAAVPITLESPSSPGGTVYEKLYDSTFIRCNRISPGDTMVQLRHYDFTGKLLRDTVLTYSIPINALTTRFNPHDSSIALLCSGTRGIWLTYLDRELNLWRDTAGTILHDLHVNAEEVTVRNVSGVFRNDTLLMVWEDYRHGDSIPDVYGNYWVLPKLLTPANDDTPGNPDIPDNPVDTSSISITMLAPNPTRGVVAIAVQSNEASETQLTLYDMMGERIWQSKSLPLREGRNDFSVDTGALGLPTGSYIFTVQSGSHLERRKLIILHN